MNIQTRLKGEGAKVKYSYGSYNKSNDEEHHIELFLLWLQQKNYQIKRGKK